MSPFQRLAAAGLAALAIAGPLGGCGGSDGNGDARKPPRSAETPPPAIPASDRRAYDVVSRASGALRAAAIPVAYGSASQIVAADNLRSAARDVAAAHPRNAALRALRARTTAALETTASSRSADQAATKRVAQAAIAEADRIDAGLRRYAASHPAANE